MNHKRFFSGLASQTPPRGLTIIETMVAMVVLAIGLVSVAGLTASVSEQTQYNRMYSIASALAAKLMEEVRTYGCNPRMTLNACDRLFNHYDEPSRNTRLYCIKDKGRPIELVVGATNNSCDGVLLLGNILVTTPAQPGSNNVDYERQRLEDGEIKTPQDPDHRFLNNIANIRVSVRWNDVNLDGTVNSSKRPMFAVYQTRVTQ